MLIPDVVARLQIKFQVLQNLLPPNTRLLYEFFVEPDEGATSDDGCFLLVTPRNNQSGYHDVLAELNIHYNMGQGEDFDIREVRQWLKNYTSQNKANFPYRYHYVVETIRDGLPRFIPNGKIDFSWCGGEHIFSQILSRN